METIKIGLLVVFFIVMVIAIRRGVFDGDNREI
jgi:hypothetical protein